jgi:hypothetical protein
LIDQLERQDTEYTVVKVIPFGGGMIPEVVPTEEHCIVLGATAMSKISKEKGWKPGYFDDNIDYRNLLLNYGSRMMNAECVVSTLAQLEKKWDEFHLRPVLDSKSFSGEVMSWDAFVEWREKLKSLDAENSFSSLTRNDLVVMSPLKKIFAEYRFFVVDGKVITGSMYKQGSRIYYSNIIDPSLSSFAQSIVDIWVPNRAFALDIADTPIGYKVIEINSFNSAGFYACDMGKFVNAINNMKF